MTPAPGVGPDTSQRDDERRRRFRWRRPPSRCPCRSRRRARRRAPMPPCSPPRPWCARGRTSARRSFMLSAASASSSLGPQLFSNSHGCWVLQRWNSLTASASFCAVQLGSAMPTCARRCRPGGCVAISPATRLRVAALAESRSQGRDLTQAAKRSNIDGFGLLGGRRRDVVLGLHAGRARLVELGRRDDVVLEHRVQLADVDGEEDALRVVEFLGHRAQRVDADDAAAVVEQRAAAVAGIDRRRVLDQPLAAEKLGVRQDARDGADACRTART